MPAILEKVSSILSYDSSFSTRYLWLSHKVYSVYVLKCKKQRPSWKACGSLASSEIPHTLCNPSFITVLTTTCHFALPWTRLIKSMPSQTLSLRVILILSSHTCPGLPGNVLPSRCLIGTYKHYLPYSVPSTDCVVCRSRQLEWWQLRTQYEWAVWSQEWVGIQLCRTPQLCLGCMTEIQSTEGMQCDDTRIITHQKHKAIQRTTEAKRK